MSGGNLEKKRRFETDRLNPNYRTIEGKKRRQKWEGAGFGWFGSVVSFVDLEDEAELANEGVVWPERCQIVDDSKFACTKFYPRLSTVLFFVYCKFI